MLLLPDALPPTKAVIGFKLIVNFDIFLKFSIIICSTRILVILVLPVRVMALWYRRGDCVAIDLHSIGLVYSF